MRRALSRRWAQLSGRHPRLTLAGLAVALLLSALAATVPPSSAAFNAQVSNSNNSVSTQPYFTCAAAITANSPRIYYKLDEPSSATTATDSSGQGRNGTYQGTTTKGTTGACARDNGTAVTFNGTSGYINLATSLSVPTTYSVSAWFKTTTTSGGLIAGFGNTGLLGLSTTVDRVLYLTNAGALVFGTNNTAKSTITAAGPYRDGKWHHVTATLGTAGMRLYVDGTQAASSSTTANAAYTGYLRVGFDNLSGWTSAPSSNYLNATLDEVAVYSTTLTATDAANQYNAGL